MEGSRRVGKVQYIKDRTKKLAMVDDDVLWEEYFEDLYNMDTDEQVSSICVVLMVLEEVLFGEER